MSEIVSAALRLRRIATCLRAGLPIPADDAMPLSDGIEAFLDGTIPSLDAAFGVKGSRGQLDARRALLLADRDDAVCALAVKLGGEIGGPDSEAVWNVFEALEDFAAAWPSFRTAVECPPRLRGRPQGLCWTILRASGGKVISRKWISAILARN